MARRRYPLRPVDRFGRKLKPGDRVRLLRRPLVKRDPPETKIIFRRAVGLTFLVEELSDYGHAELDLHKIEPWNSVWVEPDLLCLVQRGRLIPSQRWHRRQLAI